MTTEPTTDTPEDLPPAAETAPDDPEVAEPAQEEPAGSKREAKYRRQLRDAEAELAAITGKLDVMRRAEAERIAGTVIAEPAALWATDVTLDALLAEDGTVDPDLVTAAAEAARDQFRLERSRPANHVPREGRTPTTARSTSFESAFSPR